MDRFDPPAAASKIPLWTTCPPKSLREGFPVDKVDLSASRLSSMIVSRGWPQCVVLFVVLLLSACQTMQRRGQESGRPQGAVSVQALVGLADYNDLEFQRADPANSSNLGSVDLATMPAIGAAGQYKVAGGNAVEVGIDGSFFPRCQDRCRL